jgi:hypothetical protein
MAGIKFLLAELRTYQPVIPPEVGDALRILFVKVESVLHKEPETIKHCRIKTNFFCGQKTNFFCGQQKKLSRYFTGTGSRQVPTRRRHLGNTATRSRRTDYKKARQLNELES